MIINGIDYNVIDVYDQSVTIPDSFVIKENKTGKGHGEAKLYMGSKDSMRYFYTGNPNNEGFVVKCFVLKRDLISLLNTIKHEYQYPSIKYKGIGDGKNMLKLWKTRMEYAETLPNIIIFEVKDQQQIRGSRGYVNSIKNRTGYDLIRTMALPFVSYISVMKVQEIQTQEVSFYWRPFADFTQMASMQYAAQHYGKGKKDDLQHRKSQVKYREELYNEFHHCPFTQIDEFRLLVASHIKPYAVSSKKEQTDSNNGLLLSPLYDKLFDKGYISFDNDGHILISEWLSPKNKELISFVFSPADLNLNEQRLQYMKYHRENVFK